MPRYFFDFLDQPDLCDKTGAELPNDAAAKQEAMLRAMDARSDNSLTPQGATNELAVRNEAGEQILRIRLR
jgi:uncharacterized protein DUF6894